MKTQQKKSYKFDVFVKDPKWNFDSSITESYPLSTAAKIYSLCKWLVTAVDIYDSYVRLYGLMKLGRIIIRVVLAIGFVNSFV